MYSRKKASALLAFLSLLSVLQLLQINIATSQLPEAYYPSGYNLLGATAYVSGVFTDLQSDNNAYMIFRSYATATSSQALYTHLETTTIAGTSFYLQKLASADTTGMSQSASMTSTGRQLWGKFVYPLGGVNSIPASTWTIYYRTWHSSIPADIVTNPPSSVPAGTWTNPTYAYASDNLYATTSTDLATQQYGNYGFTLPSYATITKVEVGFEAYTAENEKIGITVSWDGGTTWATEYVSASLGTTDPNTVTWVDFTAATSWAVTKLSNTNFRTRAKGVKVGTMNPVYLDWIPARITYTTPPFAHADVDILIRKSDGAVRQTIATDVAGSANLTTTTATLSGTYSWSAYTVADQADYLEIDYYIHVTTAKSGVAAYLRIDDNTLAIADQTRATNIMLPSEYTLELEFTGSSNMYNWTQLVWAVDNAWSVGTISVTLQLYNYTLGAYPTSGNGYIAYTSNTTPNTDETKNQTVTTNPTHFRDALGNWKIKIKGVKSTTSQFDLKVDLAMYKATSSVSDIAVLSVTPADIEAYPTWINPLNITVIVVNQGAISETFNVSAYYNNTLISTQTVTNLAAGTNSSLVLQWNLTGVSVGIYIIKAEASVIAGEADISDNILTNGTVKIKFPADANDDSKVDGKDLYKLALAWGSRTGNPKYDQATDFNGDGKTDGKDLYRMSLNWGKTGP